jgi:glutamine---fructose-6-phosphate transaminase (isomerizing)
MSARPPADQFLGEILEQPAVMRRTAQAVAEQVAGLEALHALAAAGAHFVLTGMGSSHDACLSAASVLARRGVLATPVNAAELLHFRLGALTASTPVLAISQSGGSAELVRLAEELERVVDRPPLVTLTNGLDNPLAGLADVAFDTAAGAELSPSTKTFAACLVALRALVDAIAGDEPFDAAASCVAVAADAERAAAAATRLLADPDALAARVYAWCGRRPSLVILGRGTGRAAAEMGALLLKEAARRQAESLDSAEFRHGPLELSGPELAVAIISTEPTTRGLDAGLAAELEDDGASVMMIASGHEGSAATTSIELEDLHPMLAPAVAVIPLQLLAWRLATESGREPGRLTRASKVTTTE